MGNCGAAPRRPDPDLEQGIWSRALPGFGSMPGGNPHRHRESTQKSTQKKALPTWELNPGPFCCKVPVLTTTPPYRQNRIVLITGHQTSKPGCLKCRAILGPFFYRTVVNVRPLAPGASCPQDVFIRSVMFWHKIHFARFRKQSLPFALKLDTIYDPPWWMPGYLQR